MTSCLYPSRLSPSIKNLLTPRCEYGFAQTKSRRTRCPEAPSAHQIASRLSELQAPSCQSKPRRSLQRGFPLEDLANSCFKCDESQPQCKKCMAFGVVCNYNGPNSQDLQPASLDDPSRTHLKGSFGELAFDSKPRLPSVSLRPTMVIGSGQGSFQLDAESIGRLDRFHRRTVYTFAGSHNCQVYQNQVTDIAIEVRYEYIFCRFGWTSFHFQCTS